MQSIVLLQNGPITAVNSQNERQNMKNFKLLICCVFIVFVTSQNVTAKKAIINLNNGENSVEFLAVGNPSFLKIRGKGGKLEGKLKVKNNSISGKLSVDLALFDTGMGLRNRHMKGKYFEIKKFPKAILKLSKIKLSENLAKNTSLEIEEFPFTGSLTLHGVKKSIQGTADISRDGNRVSGVVKFSIDITQFNIDIPSFKGITVAKIVEITAKINAPIRAKKKK